MKFVHFPKNGRLYTERLTKILQAFKNFAFEFDGN